VARSGRTRPHPDHRVDDRRRARLLLVCSDGLWNYASEATELAALVHDAVATDPDRAQPLPLAASLTQWANDQGGKDNITVALARLGPRAVSPPPGRTAAGASAVEPTDPDQEGTDG